MDKLTRYREIIRRDLREFAEWAGKADRGPRYELVHDPATDHFELIHHGWDARRHIHTVVYHLDVIDGKVWVQFDATDRPIAERLVEAGIPKEDIVLAEQPPEVRPYTGYAVG